MSRGNLHRLDLPLRLSGGAMPELGTKYKGTDGFGYALMKQDGSRFLVMRDDGVAAWIPWGELQAR